MVPIGAPPAFDVPEMPTRREDFVRKSMQSGPQVEAKLPPLLRTDCVNVPQAHPLDDAEAVVLGLGKNRANGKVEPLGELLEPLVGRRLRRHAVRVTMMLRVSSLFRYSHRCCSTTWTGTPSPGPMVAC